MHQEVTPLRGADQDPDGRLPRFAIVLGLRQLLDISGGVLEGDDLAAVWQRDRVVELA
jgi:hypothetical protein